MNLFAIFSAPFPFAFKTIPFSIPVFSFLVPSIFFVKGVVVYAMSFVSIYIGWARIIFNNIYSACYHSKVVRVATRFIHAYMVNNKTFNVSIGKLHSKYMRGNLFTIKAKIPISVFILSGNPLPASVFINSYVVDKFNNVIGIWDMSRVKSFGHTGFNNSIFAKCNPNCKYYMPTKRIYDEKSKE